MAKSQYFYAETRRGDNVEEDFFIVLNKLGRREVGFTITEPTPEAARQSEIDNGFSDPASNKGLSALYKVTVERIGN